MGSRSGCEKCALRDQGQAVTSHWRIPGEMECESRSEQHTSLVTCLKVLGQCIVETMDFILNVSGSLNPMLYRGMMLGVVVSIVFGAFVPIDIELLLCGSVS